jgi:hypothetical protein
MYLSTVPSYVYKITVIETGEFYFGFRKANKVQPDEDLLKKYFSSSKLIKSIIKEKGLEAIKGQIVFISENFEESYWEEQKLIQAHFGNPLLLNKHYQKTNMGFKMFFASKDVYKRIIETRKKRGRDDPNRNPEWLRKQQECHAKRYLVTPPGCEPYEIFNLKAHCIKHNLSHSAMSQVGQGKKPHHKKWGCKRLDP